MQWSSPDMVDTGYIKKKSKKISQTREFASARTNAIKKYGEGLEKMTLNGPGKRKLGQETNYGIDS